MADILLKVEENVLPNLAKAIMAKTGKSEPLTLSQFQAEVESIVPTDSLEGLENGYDIMFYDEHNYGLASYSIKQGHTINPPVYDCKAWQTSDGSNIEFPYTPTADLILYANNDTLVSQLYKFYGVDSAVYPYIAISGYSGETIHIRFGKSRDIYLRPNGGVLYTSGTLTSSNFNAITDAKTLVTKVMELCGTSLTEAEEYTKGFGQTTNHVIAMNYDNETYSTAGKWYRLDEQ